MKQGGLKSAGWIGRLLLTMRLSIAGIGALSSRSNGLCARRKKGKSRQLEELRAMQRYKSFALFEPPQSGNRKRAASHFSVSRGTPSSAL